MQWWGSLTRPVLATRLLVYLALGFGTVWVFEAGWIAAGVVLAMLACTLLGDALVYFAIMLACLMESGSIFEEDL